MPNRWMFYYASVLRTEAQATGAITVCLGGEVREHVSAASRGHVFLSASVVDLGVSGASRNPLLITHLPHRSDSLADHLLLDGGAMEGCSKGC